MKRTIIRIGNRIAGRYRALSEGKLVLYMTPKTSYSYFRDKSQVK